VLLGQTQVSLLEHSIPHAVSTESWRMRLNVCEGPIFDITKVSSGGHRATVSKQGGGAADRLQV
jgi:hypothetical protein